jgi:hypothetical protein
MGDFDKTKPAGTTKLRLSDDQIRDNWDAIEDALDRMGMKFPSGYGVDAGELLVPIFQKQDADPDTPAADKLKLYAKTVGAQPRLYVKDPGGDVKALAIPGEDIIPSGTKMLFYQDTAPDGWTIQDTLDDKLVYISKGSAEGGETGGGVHSTGTWTQPDHHHTQPTHFHTVTTGNALGNSLSQPYRALSDTYNTSEAGDDDTGDAATVNTWRPAAYVCIIAEKD